jgi:hypothetical protein
MLTRDDLVQIEYRYRRADWELFQPETAVFDIGRLMGHIAGLEAAARAVVDAVWSPRTNVFLARSLICRICMAPDGRHSPSCPVRTLTALLDGDA